MAARRRRKAAPQTAVLDDMDAYVADVANGSILVHHLTRAAYQRHLDDLAREGTAEFPYRFDRDLAARAIRFVEQCRYVKGDVAGQPLRLHPFAKFVLASMFGWRTLEGHRRFRFGFIFVPRGNAKSMLLAGASLYAAFGEGGQADVYSAATTKEQASIVWGAAAMMVRSWDIQNDDAEGSIGVKVGAKAITQSATNSSFIALASNDTKLDGLDPSWVTLDELHVVSRPVFEVLETALKRGSATLVSISTAGMSAVGVGREKYRYVEEVLTKTLADEATFGLIYACPEKMDPYSVEAQKAANPMYGTAVRPDIMATLAAKAKALASERPGYLVKRMNIWLDARSAWMDMAAWDKATDDSLDIEDFVGKPCIIGVDLAKRGDLCSLTYVFPEERDDGRRHYTVFSESWLNQQQVDESPFTAKFKVWAEEGWLHTNPGASTEFEPVLATIRDAHDRFQVLRTVFDDYFGEQMLETLGKDNIEVTKLLQVTKHLSPSMKSVEASTVDGTLHIQANPLLRFCMANVVAKVDANDNVFPRREDTRRPPIDPASALFNAFARAPVEELQQMDAEWSYRGIWDDVEKRIAEAKEPKEK